MRMTQERLDAHSRQAQWGGPAGESNAATASQDGHSFSLQGALPLLVLAGAVLLIATAIIGIHLPLTRDEIWHWPAALLFSGGLPSVEVLAAYFSGPGPLPYIIWGNLHALGADLWLLRTTSMVFLLIACVGLILFLQQMGASEILVPSAFIILQPYVFLNGFLLMSDSLAIALAIWSLYFMSVGLSEGRLKSWIAVMVLMTGLLYTRQPYVAIPTGLLAASPLLRQERTRAMLSSLGSLAAVGPLLALWGGFSTLTRQASAGWAPENMNHLLVWLGFSFWPYLVSREKWAGPVHSALWLAPAIIIAFAMSGFLSLSVLPEAGLMDHAVVLSARFGGELLPYILFSVMWATGAIICSHVFFRAWERTDWRPVLVMAVFATGLFSLAHAWKERHALPAYLLVGLLAWTEPFKRRWVVVGWILVMGLMAVALLTDTVSEALLNRELLKMLLGVGGA